MVADVEHLDEVEVTDLFPGENDGVEHMEYFDAGRDVLQSEGDAVALVADQQQTVVHLLVDLLHLLPALRPALSGLRYL